MARDTQARDRLARDDDRYAGPAARAGLAASWLPLAATVAVLLLLAGAVRWLWHGYESQTAHERNQARPLYTELTWDALVPEDWDPMRRFRAAGIDRLDDADPAAIALARQMREAWDNAPTNGTLDGARVRLSGYVVPLDMQRTDMREFLLVPYFGACIHVPAPAANQLVHVRLGPGTPALRTMDTVWVDGILHARRNDSPMGVSAYAMDAHHIARRPVLGR